MKYFEPSKALIEAIRNNDKEAIKTIIVGIIGGDPTFETCEYEEACHYIKNEYRSIHGEEIKLTSPFVLQPGEEKSIDQAKWDEQYFGLCLVWLRDNFCLKERIPHIKEVGRVAYKNIETLGKQKSRRNFEKNESLVNKATSDEKVVKWLPITAIVVVIIAIIVLITIL